MVPTECQPVAVLEQQQMDLAGPEFQSVLDVSSLLKLSAAGDHMKDDREGKGIREMESLFFNWIQQWSLGGGCNFCFTFISIMFL